MAPITLAPRQHDHHESTTTPGNASGNVIERNEQRLPGTRGGARNNSATVDNTASPQVKPPATATVAKQAMQIKRVGQEPRDTRCTRSGTGAGLQHATEGAAGQNAQPARAGASKTEPRTRGERWESLHRWKLERSVHDAQILSPNGALLGRHLREVDILGRAYSDAGKNLAATSAQGPPRETVRKNAFAHRR